MDDSIQSYADSLAARADAANVPSGILYWPLSDPYRIESFDGDEWRGECDQDLWRRLYGELHYGVKRDAGMLSLARLDERLGEWHERGEVPVAIAYYGYDTPRRTFVGAVLAAARKNEAFPQPESARQILEGKRAFFAGARLPVRSDVFDLRPFQHPGPEVHFVFPRSLFLTNLEAEPSALKVDFADGLGFRDVAFGDRVTITYADEERKQLRLSLDLNGRRLGASFELRFQPRWEEEKPPDWDFEWEFKLRDVRPYRGVHGAGWAWVFLRTGATDKKIVNPMIFADGFGYRRSNLNELWTAANRAGLATRLRDEGKDLILVGYWDRGAPIQANAMMVVAVIERILKERVGQKPLVVLGASMGGLVTRYALLWMEDQKPPIAHQVSTYLSYDTPHDGAWIPLILQKYIHWYRTRDEGELGPRAESMLSPAAQQMLWAWTNHGWPDARNHDYTGNALRATFLSELAAMKQWPKVDRFAVANGRGDAVPEHNPGILAVEWRAGCPAGADLHLQPESGEARFIGYLHAGGERPHYYVSKVPAFDGAPGGLRDSFHELAKGLRRRGDGVRDPVQNSCFIPTVSALGLNLMSEPFTPIESVRGKVPFKDFMYSDYPRNTGHTEVRAAMREFVLKHCAPRSDD